MCFVSGNELFILLSNISFTLFLSHPYLLFTLSIHIKRLFHYYTLLSSLFFLTITLCRVICIFLHYITLFLYKVVILFFTNIPCSSLIFLFFTHFLIFHSPLFYHHSPLTLQSPSHFSVYSTSLLPIMLSVIIFLLSIIAATHGNCCLGVGTGGGCSGTQFQDTLLV